MKFSCGQCGEEISVCDGCHKDLIKRSKIVCFYYKNVAYHFDTRECFVKFIDLHLNVDWGEVKLKKSIRHKTVELEEKK